MPARREELSLERLREAVARRVEERSLRRVARDVGMSPSGLQKFLDGATPYSATLRKLERWYVREAAAAYGTATSEVAVRAALRVLGQELPPGERRRALADVLDRLEAAYRATAQAPPAWLARLREEFARDPGG